MERVNRSKGAGGSPKLPGRRLRGFEPASGLLKERIRVAGESRGFAVARLLTDWAEIVGPEIAAIARPVKIGYAAKGGMGATLTLLTTGAAAPMLQMELPGIVKKVNACYGYAAISRIHVTQTAPTGFSEGQADFGPAPVDAPRAPTPEAQAEARAAVAGVEDGGLHDALEQLVQNFYTRSGTSRPKSG